MSTFSGKLHLEILIGTGTSTIYFKRFLYSVPFLPNVSFFYKVPKP